MSAKYSPLSGKYTGQDDKPDLSSDEQIERGQYNHPTRKRTGTFFRMVIEVSILAVLIMILLIEWRRAKPNASLNSIIPDFGSKPVIFAEDNSMSSMETFNSTENLHETMKHWTTLSSRSRGTLYLDPAQRNGLPAPYDMSDMAQQYNSTLPSDVYIVSVFHQLHCLSHIMTTYGMLVTDGELPTHNLHHVAHCFDYIRQGILCAGDTTIEGHTGLGEGWGSTHHCKDIEAIKQWVDDHHGLPIADFVPDHL